jgi:hypothetical protein
MGPTMLVMPSAHAQELLAARARRRSVIRNRVVAAVLATFALAWGAVVWDGSMGEPTATAQTTTPTATPDSTTADDSTSSSTDDTTSSDDDSSSSGTLTTAQS